MFTGIVEKKAKIKKSELKDGLLIISLDLPKSMTTKLGDSVSISGCCLTVYKKSGNSVSFQIMKETMDKTIFGKKIPKEINVELAMKLSDRLGGHIVSGHIDTIGVIEKVEDKDNEKYITIKFPKKFSDFVIKKGSVTIDGVSLTIAKCTIDSLSVALIPHTLKTTTLNSLRKGDCVNIEFDIVSKHIVNLIKKTKNEK